MNSFLDMAPTTARVAAVGADKYPVPGVKLKGLAYLIKRYWSVIYPLTQNSMSNQDLLLQLMDLGDDVVAAVIAAGMGHAGSEDAEKIAAALPLGKQMEFLAEIIEESMPDGISPFVGSATKLIGVLAKLNDGKPAPAKGGGVTIRSKKLEKSSTT